MKLTKNEFFSKQISFPFDFPSLDNVKIFFRKKKPSLSYYVLKRVLLFQYLKHPNVQCKVEFDIFKGDL